MALSGRSMRVRRYICTPPWGWFPYSGRSLPQRRHKANTAAAPPAPSWLCWCQSCLPSKHFTRSVSDDISLSLRHSERDRRPSATRMTSLAGPSDQRERARCPGTRSVRHSH